MTRGIELPNYQYNHSVVLLVNVFHCTLQLDKYYAFLYVIRQMIDILFNIQNVITLRSYS